MSLEGDEKSEEESTGKRIHRCWPSIGHGHVENKREWTGKVNKKNYIRVACGYDLLGSRCYCSLFLLPVKLHYSAIKILPVYFQSWYFKFTFPDNLVYSICIRIMESRPVNLTVWPYKVINISLNKVALIHTGTLKQIHLIDINHVISIQEFLQSSKPYMKLWNT